MSAQAQASSESGRRAAKPAASLLTVPIFRDRSAQAPRKDMARPAPAPAAEPATAPARSQPASEAPQSAPPRPAPRRPAAARRPLPAQPAQPPEVRDLRHYWRRLSRGGFPDIAQFDANLIARRWPYTMLIRVPEDGLLDIVRVFAPQGAERGNGSGGLEHPFAGDHTSQLSSWVLGLAQEAAPKRQPTEAREVFRLEGRSKTVTAELLPCVSAADSAAYVLLRLRDG